MEERQLKTGIDRFLDIVHSVKEKRISDAAKELGVPEATVELWADILYQDGLVEIGYDGFGKMVVTAKKEEKKPSERHSGASESEGSAEEKKGGLLKRFGSLRKKNDMGLLKKYSAIKDASAPKKESMFSRLFGALKKPAANKAPAPKNEPVQPQAKAPAAPNPLSGNVLLRKRTPDDLGALRKRIEELKKLNG